MSTWIAEFYVAGVLFAGVGVGVWLQFVMENTGQIAVKLPSPFRVRVPRTVWIGQEGPAAA